MTIVFGSVLGIFGHKKGAEKTNRFQIQLS
jgi:hypothetical protein